MRSDLLIYTVLILIFFSCKKKEENNKPEVLIIHPIENTLFQVLDTVLVSFEVKDDEEVQFVELSLVDENFAIVDETVHLQVNSPQKTINREYMIMNLDLVSGVYYIEVKAYDGENIQREYIKILLSEFPLLWEGLLVVLENGSLSKIDIEFQNVDLWNLPFPYSFGDIDNRNGNFYLGNGSAAKLVALDLDSGQLIWEGDIIGSPSDQYFKDIFYDIDDQSVIYSSCEHQVRSYDANGVERSSILFGIDDDLETVYKVNGYTFVEVNSVFNNQNELEVYFSQTGNLVSSDLFDGDIVDILSMNEEELLILGNDEDENGFLSIYDIESNNFDNHYLFGERALSFAIVDQQKIVIGLENSAYKYDFVTSQLILLESGASYTQMSYEPVNDILFCVTEDFVAVFQPSSWALIEQYNFGSEIQDIFNTYSK